MTFLKVCKNGNKIDEEHSRINNQELVEFKFFKIRDYTNPVEFGLYNLGDYTEPTEFSLSKDEICAIQIFVDEKDKEIERLTQDLKELKEKYQNLKINLKLPDVSEEEMQDEFDKMLGEEGWF